MDFDTLDKMDVLTYHIHTHVPTLAHSLTHSLTHRDDCFVILDLAATVVADLING